MNSAQVTTVRGGGIGSIISDIFSNPITATIMIVAAIALIVDRQLRPRPLDNRELLLTPLALFYFGGNALWGASVTTLDGVDIVLSLAIGLYFGYMSLNSLKLYADKIHGEAMIEGTWGYLRWFVYSMVCRLIIASLFYFIEGGAMSLKTAEAGFLLSTAAFVGVRSVALYYKAEHLGIPLAQKRKRQ